VEAARPSCVLVTNEVGMGVVPESPLGRAFRDLAGRAHQRLGRSAGELYMAMMGVIVRLRPAPLALVGGGGGDGDSEGGSGDGR
jgi:adenosylcobinamide kinase / adenosylcobinamide-phosphate guanylyltransferase